MINTRAPDRANNSVQMTLNHTCSFVRVNHSLKFDWVDFHLYGIFVFIPIWALHNSLTLGILKGSVGCKNFYFTWGHFSCVLWIVKFWLINDQWSNYNPLINVVPHAVMQELSCQWGIFLFLILCTSNSFVNFLFIIFTFSWLDLSILSR